VKRYGYCDPNLPTLKNWAILQMTNFVIERFPISAMFCTLRYHSSITILGAVRTHIHDSYFCDCRLTL